MIDIRLLIKILSTTFMMACFAFGIRAINIFKSQQIALGIAHAQIKNDGSDFKIKTLNFLRGDYAVESPSSLNGIRRTLHWTVNIRTGAVISWEMPSQNNKSSGLPSSR